MRLISSLLVAFLIGGCSTDSKVASEIIPTTGVFSQEEERVFELRFEDMVKAFQSGQDTTNYDTEIRFGEDLVSTPLPRGDSKSLPASLLLELTEYAEGQNSDSFMIYENGRVIAESYFGKTSSESLLKSKSLSKPLGVIAVGRAIKLGYIQSLDQPVSDYIIEWKGTDKDGILIRHLLDMRSGLLPQGYAPDVQNVLNRAYLHPRHDEVLIHEYPLVEVPGQRYEYSNANSELVAIVIERATGKTYPNWLAEEVLSPLGAGGGKIWMNRVGGTAHSGCCARLASETYLKLAVLILEKGEWAEEELLSPEFVDEMLTATPQNKYAGMGLFLGRHYKKNRGSTNPDDSTGFGGAFHSEPYLDKDLALFDGNGNQVAYIMPSRNIVAMRLGARPRNEQLVWDNAYIPNRISRELNDP